MIAGQQQTRIARCLAVWVLASSLVAATLHLVRPDLDRALRLLDPEALAALSYEDALTSTAAVLVAACAAWAWTVVTLAVLEAALRVRLSGCPRMVRHMVLLACGVGLVSGMAPAVADQGAGQPPRPTDSGRTALAGLQVPDRSLNLATNPSAQPSAQKSTQPSTRPSRGTGPGAATDHDTDKRSPVRPHQVKVVTVGSGDTLWSIAANTLAPSPTDVAITRRWRAIWAHNLAVVGDDPGLIHPGMVLRLPTHPNR